MKILFFLESLHTGGKERRAIELFHYLKQKTDYDFQIILTEEDIHYTYILDLGIPIIILKRGLLKKDPLIFFKFFNIVRSFKPDIIHAWGSMTTLYAIPSAKIFNIPLINGQIADSIPISTRSYFFKIVWYFNHYFSDVIIANSKAGLSAYSVNLNKGSVIYNGVRLERFQKKNENEQVKNKLGILTPFSIIMVARFKKHKNYELFFEVAKKFCELRSDVSFVAVGDGETKTYFIEKVKEEKMDRFFFTGKISNVETLVNACDIGILFSNIITGEGISNVIIEYMALSKPVIATDAGGTCELVANKISGYLVEENIEIIVKNINELLDNPKKRKQMGEEGYKIIETSFTIDNMGKSFIKKYEYMLLNS